MNIVSTIAAAAIAIGAAATTAEAEHVQRALVLGGQEVPINSKLYTVGVRGNPDAYNSCVGALIASNLVLTTWDCMRWNPEYVSVGSHYSSGTDDGEQIKVKSVFFHIESENPEDTYYDFAALVLERSSIHPHVNLPEPNAPIQNGTWAKAMGWGVTSFPDGFFSRVLMGVGLQVRDHEDCSPQDVIYGAADLCAGGVSGTDLCYGDRGAPLIVEGNDGDSDDVLYGLSNESKCTGNGPTSFAAVSTAVEWIRNIALENPATTI